MNATQRISLIDPDAGVNLMGMDLAALEQFFMEHGEKPFRAKQVMQWIYQFGVTDFHRMTNLSKSLREKLLRLAHITPPKVKYKEFSTDGTRKWIFEVAGGALVETVLIPADDGKKDGRKTLCISSQVGCALDCSFCSTGKQGFERDLSASEIIGQLWVANASYNESFASDSEAQDSANKQTTNQEVLQDTWQNPVTNVVMMGMGEPLLNYQPVVRAMKIMLSDHAYGLSKRRVTLSTSGVVPKMYDLFDDIDVALAISLHAPNDALRNELVPINKKYPLEELMQAARAYVEQNPRHKKHVTIEYVMLAGINDSDEHAKQLINLLDNLPSKVNLIPFNPFPHAPYKRSSNNRIHAFSELLSNAGFVCTIRQTRGDDIDAACGQLVGQVADRTRRSERWQEKIAMQQRQ